MRALRQTVACALLALGVNSIGAGELIQPNPASQKIEAPLDPCHQHTNHHCRVDLEPVPAVHLPSGGSAWFRNAMANWNADWQVNDGGAVNGTLRITKYNAYNDCIPGGADFHMLFEKAAGDPDTITWSQSIFTNQRKGGPAGVWANYMDIKDGVHPETAKPPLYPGYWPEDGHFEDKPARPCPSGGAVAWNAEVYIAQADFAAEELTVWNGVEWGFLYFCWPKTPLAADDGSGDGGSTTGSRDSVIQYTPTGPGAGQLSMSGPINIMNTTGGDELDPLYAGDPLLSCTMWIGNLDLVGEQDATGGYVFLFQGEPGEYNMEILGPGGAVALRAQVWGLYCNDAMFASPGAFNMVAIYGYIDPINEIGSEFMNCYSDDLRFVEDGRYMNAPQFVVATEGPFSTLIGDGLTPVGGSGTVKNGFNEEEPWRFRAGDADCNGLVDTDDIQPFVEALTAPGTYAVNHPVCAVEEVCDCNGDESVNGGDIAEFVNFLTSGA